MISQKKIPPDKISPRSYMDFEQKYQKDPGMNRVKERVRSCTPSMYLQNLQIQCRLTHTPVIFPFGNQEGGRNVVRPCCVDLIEAQHSQDRYKVPPTSCQNLTALRPASVRQRCLVYLAGAVGTGWSRDTRIPCKFSLTPYLFKPHISLKPIIYKEPLER